MAILRDMRGLDHDSREKLRRGFKIATTSPASDKLLNCCGVLMVYDGKRHVCQLCRRTDPPVYENPGWFSNGPA